MGTICSARSAILGAMLLPSAISHRALASLLAVGSALCQAQPLPTKAPTHDHASDTAAIRTHRLQRLQDKLTIPAEELHQSCRYESDIATRPPFKQIALTFDDGPEPGQTPYILALLRKYHIPAAFFMIGEKAQKHPELVQAVRNEGVHLIGNHSWSHPNFHAIAPAEQEQEVLRGEEALGDALVGKFFRYPYGNSSCETQQLLQQRGFRTVGWHVDSCDWAFDHHGSVDAREAMECGVLPQNRSNYVEHVLAAARAHQGGIVLMHEIHPNTLHQLEAIIRALQADGFSFARIDDAPFSRSLR